MKILYILNVANRVNNFSYSSMMAAKKLGIEFHIAGNWGYKSDDERKSDEEKYGIKIHQIDFIRSPFNLGNIKAYKQLLSLMKSEDYDAVHTNTPIGGILGRLAAKKLKIKKVIYQAHGFHFYKGAPLLNWLIYYPVEYLMAKVTDTIFTINEEDYIKAKKFKLRNNGKVYKINGVGINTDLNPTDKHTLCNLRSSLGINPEDIMLISMGDLIKRKNYKTSIKAISSIKSENVHYFICGTGVEEENLKKLSEKMNVQDRVHFLGFRTDVKELLELADIFLFSTLQEGLSRSLMEAMATGLPCVVSSIRGNTDLISNGEGGFLCEATDEGAFAQCIDKLANDSDLRNSMKNYNLEIIKQYSFDQVINETICLYKEVLLGEE